MAKGKKGVDSPEAKKLKAEDEVSKELFEQSLVKAEEKAEEAKKANQVDVSNKPAVLKTKAQRQALVDAYSKKNPIKYAMKKSRLTAWINS